MRWPRATAPSWPVHLLLAFCAVAGLLAYELAGAAGRPIVQTVAAAVPAVTWMLALLSGHLGHRRPWIVAVGGLALLLGVQLLWPAYVRDGHLGAGGTGGADLALFGAHGLFLAGTVMALRRRMTQDAGGILDASLIGLCAGGPMWVWLIQPHLSADVTALGQVLTLVDVLALCGVMGCFMRMSTAGGPARGPLLYLLATGTLTLAAISVGAMSAGRENRWAAALWLLAFLTLAVTPLMPGAYAVTEPARSSVVVGDTANLVWLAGALGINPLITAVQVLRGSDSANLLLAVGTLMVIPMVLLRFHRLTVQQRSAELTLAHQASHDELTGLRNRRHVLAEIDRALAETERGDLDGVTVLLCDLDGFKPINDRYGHLVGDEGLTVVADRLAGVAGPGDTVARLGGDEFLVMRRAAADTDGLARRIEQALRHPMELSAGPVTVGVTVGAASARRGDGTGREALIARADTAMYTGKPGRRPQVQPAAGR